MDKVPTWCTRLHLPWPVFQQKGAGADAPFGVGHLYTIHCITLSITIMYRKARKSYLGHACVLKICFPPSKCRLQEVMPMSCMQLGHFGKQLHQPRGFLVAYWRIAPKWRGREQSLCRPGIDHMLALYLSIESKEATTQKCASCISIQRMNSAICGLSWPVMACRPVPVCYVKSLTSVKTQKSVSHVQE